MKPKEISFCGNDPGAVKFGNFINYYTFHSVKERIEKFSPKMFPENIGDTLLCLDIGCNSGELTNEFYLYLKYNYQNTNIRILAVDIDPVLIERAKDTYSHDHIIFASLDIATDDGQKYIKEYLHVHGQETFDITFCFSVTMWIHLNNGDDGLLQFLKFTKDISKTIVIESQPWSCYRNAQRRVKRQGNDFPLYHTLKIRSDVNDVIENIMTPSHSKVHESQNSSWKRKIQSFYIK